MRRGRLESYDGIAVLSTEDGYVFRAQVEGIGLVEIALPGKDVAEIMGNLRRALWRTHPQETKS